MLPPVDDEELFELVASNSHDNGTAILQDGTPQQRAFGWIRDVDTLTKQRLQRHRQRDRRLVLQETPEQTRQRRLLSDNRIVQRYRLMCIYFGMNGKDWLFKGRWGGPLKHECSWPGLQADPKISFSCDNQRIIREMHFFNNRVKGELVPELGEMTELRSLTIDNSENEGVGMTGGIPHTFKRLTKIGQLKIRGHELTKPLPDDLFALMKQAVNINLGNNALPGPIPKSISGLKAITQLNLGNNKLTGPIPTEIGVLKKMYALILAKNELDGPIPSQISELTGLNQLKLNKNNFTGPFPDISEMTKLRATLDLSNNKLSGPIPDYFDRLSELQSLYLGGNGFTGSVPNMSGLKKLRKLDFSGIPNLTGNIPQDPVCNNIEDSGCGLVDCHDAAVSDNTCTDKKQIVCCDCCVCAETIAQ